MYDLDEETEVLLRGILNNADNASKLTDYARRELEIAGLFRENSDYGGMIGAAVYDLVRLFSLQGHSGMSAEWVTELVTKLFRFRPITENDHSEYVDQSQLSGAALWQCKRDSRFFSDDEGKSWQNVDDRIDS